MTDFDIFPRRERSHKVQDLAESGFENLIEECSENFVQIKDQKDYGTDYQIEVCSGVQAMNIRVHVQLKGTESESNADGSVSRSVQRTNLNYLLMSPYSIYVCYHIPTRRLLVSSAEDVVRSYEHSDRNWSL